MISFKDLLVESLSDKYNYVFLIRTFDEFMDYFSSSTERTGQLLLFCKLTGLFADVENYKNKTASDKDDFYLLYQLAEKNNKPIPVVGKYEDKNKFAFRRWVYSYGDDWESLRKMNGVIDRQPIDTDEFIKYIQTRKLKTGFAGFHNTSLKEGRSNGITSMSGQDFETVVSTYYNYKYCNQSNTDHDTNITKEFIMQDQNCSSHMADKLMEHINDERKGIDRCVSCLNGLLNGNSHGRLRKLSNSNKSVSSTWIKLGDFKSRPMSTPKTDVITEDNKIRLSLKNFGGSQAMSGARNESVATIKTALLMYMDEMGDTPESETIKNGFDILFNKEWGKHKSDKTIKQLKSEEDNEMIKKHDEMINSFNGWLDNNVNNNNVLKKYLLLEAMSGKCKFLPNDIDPSTNTKELVNRLSTIDSLSLQEPNYVFTWSLDSVNKPYCKPIREYVDSVIDKTRIYLRWKSSGRNHNVAMTIEIKK